MPRSSSLTVTAIAFAVAVFLFIGTTRPRSVQAESATRVFELRVYHTNPGKLPDLIKRFREHTVSIFNKHKMTSIAYWTPLDEPAKDNTLYYVLAFPSRDAAKSAWAEFIKDPEWQKVQQASEVNGKIIDHIDSTFLEPTEFSRIR